jgi:RNA polymerase sigma-70 factor (ECF subfamily)
VRLTEDSQFIAVDAEFQQLLSEAQAGSREAVGELVDRYRNYLCLIANEQLDSVLRVKAGASDLVQESMLAAQRDLGDFRGSTHGEWLSWLRTILLHELHRTNRAYRGTSKRQMGRERPLDPGGTQSQEPRGLADPTETPGTRAAANEQSARLAQAINRLPEDYRLVLKWRNWERLSFEEIADQLGRTPDACRKIWSRAVARLRKEFEGDQSRST